MELNRIPGQFSSVRIPERQFSSATEAAMLFLSFIGREERTKRENQRKDPFLRFLKIESWTGGVFLFAFLEDILSDCLWFFWGSGSGL